MDKDKNLKIKYDAPTLIKMLDESIAKILKIYDGVDKSEFVIFLDKDAQKIILDYYETIIISSDIETYTMIKTYKGIDVVINDGKGLDYHFWITTKV